MLKLGIEPKTFALLARRSNQLSYSSTERLDCMKYLKETSSEMKNKYKNKNKTKGEIMLNVKGKRNY